MEEAWRRFRCPCCQKPILVGSVSVKPDRATMERERTETIEKSARALLKCWREGGGPQVEASLMGLLEEALETKIPPMRQE